MSNCFSMGTHVVSWVEQYAQLVACNELSLMWIVLVIKTCARFAWFAAWWRFCLMETSFVHEVRPHRFGRYGSIIDWILLSASTKTYHRLRHLRPHKGKWSIRFEFTLNPCFLPVESLFMLMKSY
jgi:hypothetical protein